jgi:uncharacterized protein YciW
VVTISDDAGVQHSMWKASGKISLANVIARITTQDRLIAEYEADLGEHHVAAHEIRTFEPNKSVMMY